MNQLIITIVYAPENGEVGVSVTKLGPDKNINLKHLLLALHAAEGQYIGALQIEATEEQAQSPPADELAKK